jgi:apolipoprotein N-acyltransferase
VKLKGLINGIVLAWGWRRATIALVAGAVSALAMAPFDIWPVMFVTFPVLVWLTDGAAVGRWGGVAVAGLTGWWFGFGYFVAGLYWIGNALLVDAPTFGWLLPFAVIGVPAMLAIFTGLGVAFARLLWTRGVLRIFALAVALTISEWLRGHVLTGFPWNVFGYALTNPLALAQSASIFGLWGLTFIAIAIFSSPATLTDDPAETRRPWLPLACSAAVLIALAGYGESRLRRTHTTFVDGVHLRIMQPNLPQDTKFNYAAKDEVMKRYVTLSDRAAGPNSTGMRDVTHLIWPESAFPFFLTREPDAMAQIAALLPERAVLITGAIRLAEPVDPKNPAAYNSIYVIDHDGSILALYDKVHLVPFGEYLPLERYLERLGLQNLGKIHGGFLSGDRRRLIAVRGTPPMLPLICYEAIFPDDAVPRGDRPGWLVNVTNDGWFGMSTGPHQHFQQARVLAIEEGLPLVRAANTGISAVIDPLGRIIQSLPLGTEGVIDAPLPKPIRPTIYVRAGNGLAGLMVAIALVVIVRRRLQRMKI